MTVDIGNTFGFDVPPVLVCPLELPSSSSQLSNTHCSDTI
jgi:hypothetical protein